MNVVQLPRPAETLEILAYAPIRSAESPFMGLMETIAWAALRDERIALAVRWHSLDRPDLDALDIGAAWMMLAEAIEAQGGTMRAAEREVTNKCAVGDLKAKGQASGGYRDIPADDWLGGKIFQGKLPDTLLVDQASGQGWHHVQFRRDDVLAMWPGTQASEADVPRPKPRRKPGPKINPVWARAYALAYRNHRDLCDNLSDEAFREWIVQRNPTLGKQASPLHHKTVAEYRFRAQRGDFEIYLGT